MGDVRTRYGRTVAWPDRRGWSRTLSISAWLAALIAGSFGLIDPTYGQSCEYARDRYQTLLSRRALEEFKYTFRRAAYRVRAPASEAQMLCETGLRPQPRRPRIGAAAGYPGPYPEGSFFAAIPLGEWTFVEDEFRPSRLVGFSPAPGAMNYAAAILLVPAEFDRLVACFLEDDYAWGVKNQLGPHTP